jgi:hypothetical protein
VFRSAASTANSAVSSLINGIVNLFSKLPGRLVSALGNIGSRIVSKIKSGLPSAVRAVLPFAEGGIVTSPVMGLVGEAGPEVIIPLTKPQRAAQLAADSGLLNLLAKQGAVPTRSQARERPVTKNITNVWNISTVVDDPMVLAHHLHGRVARAAGV